MYFFVYFFYVFQFLSPFLLSSIALVFIKFSKFSFCFYFLIKSGGRRNGEVKKYFRTRLLVNVTWQYASHSWYPHFTAPADSESKHQKFNQIYSPPSGANWDPDEASILEEFEGRCSEAVRPERKVRSSMKTKIPFLNKVKLFSLELLL